MVSAVAQVRHDVCVHREEPLRAFARQLAELRLAAGKPSYAKLSQRSRWLPTSTTADALGAKARPSLDFTLAFVDACQHFAREVGLTLPPEEVDHDVWRERWRALHRHSAAHEPEQAESTASGSTGPIRWNIPPPTATFSGRKSTLEALDVGLVAPPQGRYGFTRRVAVALVGVHGVGKTQLALSWALRHAGEYEIGWLIRADRRQQAVSDLAALGRRLGLTHDDQHRRAGATVERLADLRDWLLIFDDAEEDSWLAGLLPVRGGTVLITSRRPTWEPIAECIVISPWSLVEGVAFLRDRTGDDEVEPAAEVTKILGGLPLAMEQAAAYCRRTGSRLRDYAAGLRADANSFLTHDALSNNAPGSVSVTLRQTLGHALERDSAAMQILAVMAFLAPSRIPRYLFGAASAGRLSEPFAAVQDPRVLDRALAALIGTALAECEGPGLLRVHQLVQHLVRDLIGEEDSVESEWKRLGAGGATLLGSRMACLTVAAELVLAACPTDVGDPGGWDRLNELLPHAQAINGHVISEREQTAALASMQHRIGTFLHEVGDHAGARDLVGAAVAIRLRQQGPEHPDTLASKNNLGLVQQALGDPAAARLIHAEVLAIRKRTLGPDHPHTLASLGNQALALRALGDIAGARALHEREVAACHRLFGDQNPDTLTAMSNLASALTDQGEVTRAYRLHQHVLLVRLHLFGEAHPETLTSMNGLANALRGLGQLSEARKVHEREIELCRQVLGSDHPDTLVSISDLAENLADLGDHAAALQLLQQVYAARQRVLGPDHSDTRATAERLGTM